MLVNPARLIPPIFTGPNFGMEDTFTMPDSLPTASVAALAKHRLARALQAPIVHALRGKEHIDYDNPLRYRHDGPLGFASGYPAMEHCDTLLILGIGFPYRDFHPDDVKVIHVDIRGEEIGRRVAVNIPLVGTGKDTAAALLPRLAPERDSTHLEQMTAHYKRARKQLVGAAVDRRDHGPVHPQAVAAKLDEIADDDATFLADVGTPTIWVARDLRINGRRRLLGSDLDNPSFAEVARAVGLHGVRIDQPAELEDGLRRLWRMTDRRWSR
jgi:pyruvate dehydrogenase (quinone)